LEASSEEAVQDRRKQQAEGSRRGARDNKRWHLRLFELPLFLRVDDFFIIFSLAHSAFWLGRGRTLFAQLA